MFSSYIENPKNCSFEGQDDNEKILLLLRAHPITNIPWIFWAVLLFVLPFIIPPLVPRLNQLLLVDLSTVPAQLMQVSLVIDYLLVLVITFEGFLYWYFNVYIITDKRVIDVSFESLLNKSLDLAPLENIEEADSRISGLIKTLFNFGDVMIQTAGAQVAIQMFSIPNPSSVADFILDKSAKSGG